MPRVRKPDALTPAERQRRYVQERDLVTLRVTREARARLKMASRQAGRSPSAILLAAVEHYLHALDKNVAMPSSAMMGADTAAEAPSKPTRRRVVRPEEPQLL